MPLFYVFFDKKEIKRNRVDLRDVAGPNQARNTTGYAYGVLCLQAKTDPRYQELDNNPKYVKKIVSGD